MYRYKIYLFVSIFCLIRLASQASDYSFSKLSIENGLSNNQVNTIFKDSNGFIWIGTLDGIDRYDGAEIRPYSRKSASFIENVLTINEDYSKDLWVGTTGGLFRLNRQVDTFEVINFNTKKLSVQALAILPDSNLYIGTEDGLFLINTKSFHSEKILIENQSLNQKINVTGLHATNDGYCWITTSNGLFRYSFRDKKSDFFQFSLKPQTAYNSFTSICSIGNKLYLGTSSVGIVAFDIANKTFSLAPDIDNKIILNLSSDNKELLYAGTNGGGVKIINTRTNEVKNIVTHSNDPQSLSSNAVYAFLLDKEGRYWVGTYSAGLCFTKNIVGNFQLHQLTSDYPEINKSIRSFYFAPDGSEYFGTRDGFVQLSKNGKLQLFQSDFSNKNGLKSNIILSIFPFENDILIGTYGGGVSRFSTFDKKIKPFLEDDELSQGNIYAFDTDDSGDLWITSFNGLYRYSIKDQSLINFNSQNSALKNNQVFEIEFDSKGRLWVGTMSGTYVYSYKENKLESLDLSVITSNTFKTNFIYEDLSGNIWICSEREGLIMVNPDLTNITSYREEDGLPDNSVCAIVEGSAGEYWISTLRGFCKYSSHSSKFIKYSTSEGLPGLAFTPRAVYQSEDKKLFWGNEKGLVYFNMGDLDEKSFSSEMVITDFFISSKEVRPGENSPLKEIVEETSEIHLGDEMNNIGFRFVVLNYFSAIDNTYEYQLEGFDEGWRDNGNENTVFYQDLSPGNYTFKVRLSNEIDTGTSKNAEAEIKIFIHQTFFNSIYFYVLFIVFVLGGGFILIRYIKMLPGKIKEKIDESKNLEKYKGTRISKNRCESIIRELEQRMTKEKLYLNPGLKLADLSREMNYPMNEISQVLNQDLNQSFSDYVNKYRVEEVIKRMSKGEHEKFTLVAIAKQCGFNSKTSFYRVFKKETDKTPADYLKALNLHSENL